MLYRCIFKPFHLRYLTVTSSKTHLSNPKPTSPNPSFPIPDLYFFPKIPHFYSTSNANKDPDSWNALLKQMTGTEIKIQVDASQVETEIQSERAEEVLDRELTMPDLETFAHLFRVRNYDDEEITKVLKVIKPDSIKIKKKDVLAIIKYLMSSGEFDKAKLVPRVLGEQLGHLGKEGIARMYSFIVSELISYGKVTDALMFYKGMRQPRPELDSFVILDLMHNLKDKGQLDNLSQLLGDISDQSLKLSGLYLVACYCVKHNDMRGVIDYLRRIWNAIALEIPRDNIFNEVFALWGSSKPPDVQFGIDLLTAIKEEFKVPPSRTAVDLLLTACVNADTKTAFRIWQEYPAAGLRYTGASFLRLYYVLVALGDHTSAEQVLDEMKRGQKYDQKHFRIMSEAFKGIKRIG